MTVIVDDCDCAWTALCVTIQSIIIESTSNRQGERERNGERGRGTGRQGEQ